MIEAGVMDHPPVDGVLALHLGTELPTGTIGLKYGASTASADSFELTISGKGGHGAHPHKSIDAIAAAGQVIVALQTIVSREIDPLGAAVITVGTINGGYRRNVIADQVVMTGTVRTVDPAVQQAISGQMERVIAGVCAAMRCQYQFAYSYGVPSVVNEQQMTALVQGVAQRLLGPDRVLLSDRPTMGGEDFSYFAQRAPGAMFSLGAGNPSIGCDFPIHHPRFNFDEDAVAVGMAILAESARTFLRG